MEFVADSSSEEDEFAQANVQARKLTERDRMMQMSMDFEQQRSNSRRPRIHKPIMASFVSSGEVITAKKVDVVTPSSSSSSSSSAEGKSGAARFAPVPSSGNASTVSQTRHKDFARFETHTRGIGSKLLAKWGMRGGLGKQGQGVSNPIVSKVRPKGIGIGFGNFLETTGHEEEDKRRADERKGIRVKPRSAAERQQDAHGNAATRQAWKLQKSEDQQRALAEAQRKKEQAARKRRKLEESAAATMGGAGAAAAPVKELVVDMRGRNGPVVTSMETLGMPSRNANSDFVSSSIPELQHNLRLLRDLSGEQLAGLQKKRRDVREEAAEERQKLSEATATRDTYVDKQEQLEAAQEFIRTMESSSSSSGKMPLKMYKKLFEALRTHHEGVYQRHCIAELAIHTVQPLLRRLLSGWWPLQGDAGDVLTTLSEWGVLLGGSRGREVGDVGALILDELLLQKLQLTLGSWDVRDAHAGVGFVGSLVDAELLSPRLTAALSDSLLVPKLLHALDKSPWQPLKQAHAQGLRGDTAHPSAWLGPWIETHGVLSANDSARLVEAVAHKVGLAVRKKANSSSHRAYFTDAGNVGAIVSEVQRWSGVFAAREETAELWGGKFIAQQLAPVLTEVYRSVASSSSVPSIQTCMARFGVFVEWAGVIPAAVLVQWLETRWFESFISAVCTTAASDQREALEVYRAWSRAIPSVMAGWQPIRWLRSRVLQVLRLKVGNEHKLAKTTVAQVLDILQRKYLAAPGRTSGETRSGSGQTHAFKAKKKKKKKEEFTLREMVERIAGFFEMEFCPRASNAVVLSKAVWELGGVAVAVEQHDVFRLQTGGPGEPGAWMPAALEDVLRQAREDKAGRQRGG
jgi:hypothetical protein